MQQVKKQLQDAIAELKSGWGINEVKREDLAAVLEKVVAALDRAAQLPVAPAPQKGLEIVDGYTISYRSQPNIVDTYAPPSAKPAFGYYNGSVFMCFYDASGEISYGRNSEGVSASSFLMGKLLNDGISLCYFSPGRVDGPSDTIIRTGGIFDGGDPSFIVQ